MALDDALAEIGVTGSAYAAPIEGGCGVGFFEHALVSPASVMKIQIALTVEDLAARGLLSATERRRVPSGRRTPGPVGMSLMSDEVTMSIRDLVVAMLTISDNVATDELLAVAGRERVNATTTTLGLVNTFVAGDLRDTLDDIAREAGFAHYDELVAHDPSTGPPDLATLTAALRASAALDPGRGSRTTAAETVSLLQAIWTGRAGADAACRRVAAIMAQQLSVSKIASGFEPGTRVAAKSGALLRVVRNEAGVVTLPDGAAYAVAVFTRQVAIPGASPAEIDRCIGRTARRLVDALHSG